MTHNTLANKSRSHANKTDDELWNELDIRFHIDPQEFEGNRIHGIIQIEPEEARKTIENLRLIVDDCSEHVFDSKCKCITASGFDTTKNENMSFHIEAVCKDKPTTSKLSNKHTLSMIDKFSSFLPIISLEWRSSQADLIVKWYRPDGLKVKQYIIILDTKEVYFMRKPLEKNLYAVSIGSFAALKKPVQHTINIKAILENDEHVELSAPLSFTVPDKCHKKDMQIIQVSQEKHEHHDLKKFNSENKSTNKQAQQTSRPQVAKHPIKTPEVFTPLQNQTKQNRSSGKEPIILSCGCHEPHKYFPGIEHYLNINTKESSILSLSQKQPTHNHKETNVQDRRNKNSNKANIADDNVHSTNKENNDHDDDDDVVATNIFDMSQ
ncbi:unnamed protein product [Rotaria socialis]|uniref:Uncharacterized protein n=2 Tax=Rotaria socialis TaxID=392032 RepID=A0A820TFP5_9BILA|nr:unnamed protein product [Rotaria socialis]